MLGAVSAAVDALGCRLELEQRAQWQTLREEVEKRLADMVIVAGESGPPSGNRNRKRTRSTPPTGSAGEHPTVDPDDP
jgi:hypothetical protein